MFELGVLVKAVLGLATAVIASPLKILRRLFGRARIDNYELKDVAASGDLSIDLDKTISLPDRTGDERPTEDEPELVNFTAFSPGNCIPGKEFDVKVALHLPNQFDEAVDRVRKAMPHISDRNSNDVEITRGDTVIVSLEMPSGCTVDEPIQDVVWRGRIQILDFLVKAPQDFEILRARVVLKINGVPTHGSHWTIAAAKPGADVQPEQRQIGSRAFQRAFMSYASQDRPEVLRFVPALNLVKIGYFLDLLNLKPGDRFAAVIENELMEECDLFLLFWSKAAKASAWVEKETRLAKERSDQSQDGLPFICPVPIETPLPTPPDSLRDIIHFNDYLRHIIQSEEQERSNCNP